MAFLVLQLQNGRKHTFALEEGDTFLGRGEDCDVCIDNFSISQKHAKFVRHGNLVMIEDLGSSNGLYVNDDKTHEAQLEEGDVIQVGMLKLSFSLKEVASDSMADLLGALSGDAAAAGGASARVKAGSILPSAPSSIKKKPLSLEEAMAAEAEADLNKVDLNELGKELQEKPADKEPAAKKHDPFADLAKVNIQGSLTGKPGKSPIGNATDRQSPLSETQFNPAAAPPASQHSQPTPLADGAAPPPKIDFSKGKRSRRKPKNPESGIKGLISQVKGIFSK